MFIPLTLTCVKLPHSCNKENSWMPVALSPLACHWAVLPAHPPCSRDHTCPSELQIPLVILWTASMREEWPKWHWVPLCLREGHCQPDGGL